MLKLQYFDHLMQRADSLGKTVMLGKIEGKKRKQAAGDEMVRQHHQLSGHEFEQTLGDSEGQRSLVCCSPRVTESDATYRLNSNSSVLVIVSSDVAFCGLPTGTIPLQLS